MLQVYYATAQKKLNEDKPDGGKATLRTLSTELGMDDLDQKCKSEVVDAGIRLWNASLKDYNSSRDGYPSDYQFERMAKNGTIAMLVLDYVIPSDTSKLSEESDAKKQIIIKACKNLVTMKTTWMNLKSYTVSFSGGIESHPVSKSFNMTAKQEATADIRKYHNIIKICDPSYAVPTVSEPTPTVASGGCYVATAVYGSYNCPQVWVLRRYRDYTLAETWYGRAFIYIYYAISPTLVKLFGNSAWFKKLWKGPLDSLVNKLVDKGVAYTPYEDRAWK